MKGKYLWVAAIGLLALLPAACSGPSSTGPTYGGMGGGYGSTPTPSGPPGPTTIMVSTAASGSSTTGYLYQSSSGTNGAGSVLSLSAHMGDAIVLPGSSFHPLYFDHGTSTCIYMGATSTQTYVFSSTGTYYFHCGNHGSGCSAGLGACGSTNCTAMAGIVTVN